MAADLSADARDKLRAVLYRDVPDPDDELAIAYRDACAEWFASLDGAARPLALRILEIYGDGNETKAEWLASALPPAPRFPLTS